MLALALLLPPVLALRGVAPADVAKYSADADGMWACLGDPSIKIPFEHVNDDYCDCPDGSDEPGTAACAGIAGVAKFYCANEGHIPSYIPSTYVDDGVCDYELCCDGSDEPVGKCPNRCAEVHAEHSKKQKLLNEMLAKGSAAREKLVAQAKALKSEIAARLENRQKEADRLSQAVEGSKAELKELEKAEAEAAKNSGNAETAAKVAAVKDLLRELHGATQQLRFEVQSARDAYEELDHVMSTMKNEYNPNFNDAAVKQAIRTYEEIAGNKLPAGAVNDVSIDTQLEALDSLTLEQAPSAVDKAVNWLHDVLADFSLVAPRVGAVVTSEKVDRARDGLRTLEAEANKARNVLEKDTAALAFDYGRDDVFRALADTCVTGHIGEYDYKVCVFGDASQIGNGHSTRLGRFDRIEYGDDSATVLFTQGAQCWNGPVRSARAVLRCGEETLVKFVSEAEKCEYEIEMLTPAVCPRAEVVHDEL